MAKGNVKQVIYDVFSKFGIRINRLYKNNLFQFIFGKDKKALLELYNALNGTNYTNEDEIEYVTIEGAMYLTRKNDLAFLLSDTLNMYEHQSTINPNLPVRFFIYLAEEFQKILDQQQKSEYGRSLIKLPVPKCVAFYNGTEDMEEEEKIIKLSDAFSGSKVIESDAELIVRVININAGFSEELKKKCKMLSEYSQFVQIVYENLAIYHNRNEAINKAIDYCIENDILAEILKDNRAEVLGMFLKRFDEKKYENTLREEGRESGLKEGRESGLKEGRESGLKEGRESGLKALVNTLKPILKTPEAVLTSIVSQEGFEDTTIEDVKKYW